MNLIEAKKLIGANFDTRTPKGLESAERQCRDAIVAARRADNQSEAARLSEAQQVFKKALKRFQANTCAICGTRINRRATHCRAHQAMPRGKRIAAPVSMPLPVNFKRSKQKPPTRRRFAADSMLAQLGYYTAPVQRVVRKWRKEIGEQWCEHYAPLCVPFPGSVQSVPLVCEDHRAPVLELLGAFHEVYSDRTKPDAWLLELISLGSGDDYHLMNYGAIASKIKEQGGPKFAENQLTKAVKRLRLQSAKKAA